jgi:hypothetical protein
MFERILQTAIFWILGTRGVVGQAMPEKLWQPVQEYFTIVEPEGNGPQSRQRVNPFLSFTHLGTDFGYLGPGESEIGWIPGMVCANLPSKPEGWAGMWHSLNRLARLPDDSLDFARCYPAQIADRFQPRIAGMRAKVIGRGDVKFEIKSAGQETLWSGKFAVNGGEADWIVSPLPSDRLRSAKFVNWTAEPGSQLCIDSFGFDVVPPAVEFDLYVFLASYAKAVRCYSPATGLSRDRAHTDDGTFDSVPATGLFALSSVVASKLGIVTPEFARDVLRKALAAARTIEGPHGLLPHFARREGDRFVIHPGTEFSTVDTSIFYHGTLLAARLLGDEESVTGVREAMKRIDFGPLRDAEGYVRHGVRDDRETPLPYIWRDWGGESALVLLQQQFTSGGRLAPVMSRSGRVHQGCGFVAEVQNLFYPDFDSPQPDAVSHVNWRAAREQLLDDQKSYFQRTQPPDGWARRNGIYGLSSGDGAYGVGYHAGGSDLPDQKLIHPHYILMSATLEPAPQTVYRLLARLQEMNLFPPWGLVENIFADGSEHLPLQGALNANFESLGAYHLLAKNRNWPDVVHQAAVEAPELREAIKAFYPEASL